MNARRLVKRSMTIAGHATSVALEAAFWAELERLAGGRNLARYIAAIDAGKSGGLASALRVHVLAALKAERDPRTRGADRRGDERRGAISSGRRASSRRPS